MPHESRSDQLHSAGAVSAPAQFRSVAQQRPAYQPPRLESLGRWEAVTLIGSIGFNSLPGMGMGHSGQ